MDETANQMRDVRERLRRAFERGGWTTGTDELVDIVLARFDVVERPVVTDKQLGEYAMKSVKWSAAETDVGERFRTYLTDAGLTIVRSGEAAR